MKTLHVHTRIEIYFIAYCNSHTCALSRHSNKTVIWYHSDAMLHLCTQYMSLINPTTLWGKDLDCWMQQQPSTEKTCLGAPVCLPCPKVIVHSDAFNKGWGQFSMAEHKWESFNHPRKQLNPRKQLTT